MILYTHFSSQSSSIECFDVVWLKRQCHIAILFSTAGLYDSRDRERTPYHYKINITSRLGLQGHNLYRHSYTFQLEMAEGSVCISHNSVWASIDAQRVTVQCLDKFSLFYT